MQQRNASVRVSPSPVLPVAVDALTREIYEVATPTTRARMKALACARVIAGRGPAEQRRLRRLLAHSGAGALAEIVRREPEWARSDVGAALLWMVGKDRLPH